VRLEVACGNDRRCRPCCSASRTYKPSTRPAAAS